MASSGKKGKKNKVKTVPWTEFVQDTSGITTIPVKKTYWSEELEDAFDYDSRHTTSVVLPTAPRSACGPDISDDKIPKYPPFIAYISNLPYDVEEDDISDFFSNMNISNMRLPRDDREGGKLKGFGYIEFEDRESLIDAISIIDTNLKGRRIKIDVSTNSDSDRRRGGRMEMGRDRMDRPEAPTGDWRSGPRSDPPPESRERREYSSYGGFSREREGDMNRSSGAWRDGERPIIRDSERPFRDSERPFRDSDRSGYRDSERSSYRDSDRGGFGGGGFNDRPRFSDRDGDRRGGSFGPRRNFDGYEKDGMMSRGFKDDGPLPDRSESRGRPKLNLQPRSKPVEEGSTTGDNVEEQQPAAASATSVPTASIFGAARPVDTSIRDRQIEERLAKEKDTVRPARDSSRDKNREEEEPKREVWGRKHNDDRDEDNARRESPERIQSNRGSLQQRKSDEKKPLAPRDGDRVPPPPPIRKDDKLPKKDERPPRETREMPKLKEQEPPNFVASNIFATLQAEEVDALSD